MTAGHSDPGSRIVRIDGAATTIFVLVQVLAAALAAKPLLGAAVAVASALFVAGVVIYLWAFLQAVGRSRLEEIDLASLFLLASAPKQIRRSLALWWAIQAATGLATAAARPFSSLAFGILAPMFGGAMAALWAARWGTFPPRGEARSKEQAPSEGGATTAAAPPRRRWFDPVDLDDGDDRA